MSLKIGIFDKKKNAGHEIEINPTIYCDLYVNQGKTCLIYEQALKADITPQGHFALYLCPNFCSNFIKRDFSQIFKDAGWENITANQI